MFAILYSILFGSARVWAPTGGCLCCLRWQFRCQPQANGKQQITIGKRASSQGKLWNPIKYGPPKAVDREFIYKIFARNPRDPKIGIF